MNNFEHIIAIGNWKDNAHIGLIELNRPKVLNALSTQTLNEIVQALETLQKDHRVVVITGSEKAFAAGADIQQMLEAGPIDQWSDERETLWKKFRLIKVPIIAAVNGYCLGGGHELAMSADIMIAGDDAQFGQPEVNIGTIPGAGGTQRLTRAAGKSRAMELALTGEMFDAQEALRLGLVSKVVPSKALLREALETAKKIAQKSPVAVKLIKESINQSFESDLTTGLSFERRNFYLTFASLDQKEGMRAFLEKRNPEFKGQ